MSQASALRRHESSASSSPGAASPDLRDSFLREMVAWRAFGGKTRESQLGQVPVFSNEFWTSLQRQTAALHEVSYRACFKPQLPAFFIERLSAPGEVIYDPFMGRGTTVIEAMLRGRVPLGGDVNPLCRLLVEPRLRPPPTAQVEARLEELDLERPVEVEDSLHVFYHPDTLCQITNLRNYLLGREDRGELDDVDGWIRMVATNRLTGHSSGFFSVYTMPPNQAVSLASQRKINTRRKQSPEFRSLKPLILKKTRSLLRDAEIPKAMKARREQVALFTGSAQATPGITDGSVALIVTSPPFLDIVDYGKDNWLRCWFNGINAAGLEIAAFRALEAWTAFMVSAFAEFSRVLAPGGFMAFEVGEVRRGKVRLEEAVLEAAAALPESRRLDPVCVLINTQDFTKTSNCWGVHNNAGGTNSNRIVVFEKPHL